VTKTYRCRAKPVTGSIRGRSRSFLRNSTMPSKIASFPLRFAHSLLRIPQIGIPFSRVTSAIGLETISRKASRDSRFTPSSVSFVVVDSDGQSRRGVLAGAGGRDLIAQEIWFYGLASYESPLPRLFMRLVQGAETVLDVGANSGLYAVLAALSESRCRVIAFEPFPPALASLRTNLAINHLTQRVEVVGAAVGKSGGETDLFIPESNPGGAIETSASLIKEFRTKHSEIIKVPVVALDDYVVRNQLSKVSVIRADVEGAEHFVLQGAMTILETHRPYVFVECLSDISAKYLEQVRARVGYKAMCIGTSSLSVQPEVKCVFQNFNHLWYPPEKHAKVLAAAEELGLEIIGDS
jgi:FkbM family methyltransferase